VTETMSRISGRCAIVGIGESERSLNSGKTPLKMALQAARAALADAGLKPSDIDGFLSYHDNDSCGSHWLATYLGARPTYYNDVSGGGGSTEALVADAISLIDAGIIKTCLVFRSMNGRSGNRMGGGKARDNVSSRVYSTAGASYLVPYGINTPAERYSLLATRHMHETGLKVEHLGALAITARENAQRNPNARFFGQPPLTMERYLEASYLCYPFRKYDYCIETDEANVLIITSSERARHFHRKPIYIMGVAGRNSTTHAHVYSLDNNLDVGGFYAGPQVFEMAGVKPNDINVAAVYDCFTWVALYQLEVYGFVERGGAGQFVASGEMKIGGKLPVNTAGGMLAEGYTHGMNNVIELVRQLRHSYEGTGRQVVGCRVGMSMGWGGPMSAGAMILQN